MCIANRFNAADVANLKKMGWNAIRLGTLLFKFCLSPAHFAFPKLFHFSLNAFAGVVWAGAQPRDENALDPEFLRRLDAILNLTDAHGIAVLFTTWRIYVFSLFRITQNLPPPSVPIQVMLDNHGDMVGSAGCGNGVRSDICVSI